MLQLILTWLRRSVRDSFLAGINDAVAELDKGGAGGAGADEAPALESLKARFTPAATAITEEKAAAKGRQR